MTCKEDEDTGDFDWNIDQPEFVCVRPIGKFSYSMCGNYLLIQCVEFTFNLRFRFFTQKSDMSWLVLSQAREGIRTKMKQKMFYVNLVFFMLLLSKIWLRTKSFFSL